MLRASRAVAFVLACGASACTCSKGSAPASGDAASGEDAAVATREAEAPAVAQAAGLSAPIAASRGDAGDVVVAGLDVPAKAIRVQRISSKDEVVADKTILEGVSWSSDAELKMAPAGAGVAITWRGLRGGRLVRQHVVLGADLAAKGEPIEVAAASCATQDGFWFTDGARAHGRPWSGSTVSTTLPKHDDAAIVCGAHRAFALLDEEESASLVVLGGDAGAMTVLKDSDFGEDEQRERAEFTVGDDLGVVRLATSGALAVRELHGGALGPLRKLKRRIPHDDDVVAVDASASTIVVIYTQDVGEGCAKTGGSGPSTKVTALRVDRAGEGEEVIELSPGTCGREVGPFFTGVIGDEVSVAWIERVPGGSLKSARAPIAALAHRVVKAAGASVARVEQPADAIVDAGCDATRCYAVALVRRPGADGMVPGFARVLRY
ncbi:MAG: hypothetical protein KF819_32525 [Labilithrix sp.]|nr:hypothetical protein [Labilithrix sp.]